MPFCPASSSILPGQLVLSGHTIIFSKIRSIKEWLEEKHPLSFLSGDERRAGEESSVPSLFKTSTLPWMR